MTTVNDSLYSRTNPPIYLTVPAEPGGWEVDAACSPNAGHDVPATAWDAGSRKVDDAKAVCSTCPVRLECLDYALEHPWLVGVWGGLTDRERGMVALLRGAGL